MGFVMTIDQIISLAFILGVSFHSVANADSTKGDGLKLVFLGALFVLAQLALNKISGIESTGLTPPTMWDILLVKQIRASTGVLVFGYIFVLSGLLVILRAAFSGDSQKENQNPETEEHTGGKPD